MMTYQSTDEILDWEATTEDYIELSEEYVVQASQLSQTVAEPTRQWQTYLNALALFGFQEWMAEWANDLVIDISQCSVLQTAIADPINTISPVQIGQFRVCLVATGDRYHPTVDLPRVVLESISNAPHFYVLIEVLEEQLQVQVHGYLRQQDLLINQHSSPLQFANSQMIALPLGWFNPEPTALLLELRCLDLARASMSPILAVSSTAQTAAINVATWLRDRLDDVAQDLAWVLMPAFAPADALRSVGDALQTLGIPIPPTARGAYQNLQVGSAAVRLYAVAWMLSLPDHAPNGTPDWTLLAVLSAQPSQTLPAGIRLTIQDATQILAEQALQAESENAYLYAQVGGDERDRFTISIHTATGETITLPPFIFAP